MTRTEAAAKRRERVLEATAELVGERGYLGFTVAELVKRARASLLTVRKLYGDKLGCYLAVLANTVVEARRSCAQAVEEAHGEPEAAAEVSLGALFEMAAANPAAARACLLEPFAAGEQAIDHHRRALAELGAALLDGAGGPSETAAIGMGAAVLWLPERCLLNEEPERIPGLTREAVEFAIASQQGAKGARRSLSQAAKGRGRSMDRAGHSSGKPPEEATALGRLPTGSSYLVP